MHRLYPDFRAMRPEEIYGDLAFPPGVANRPYGVVNMVTTVDGKASLGGKAFGLGSRVDRMVMRRIRAAADGLLVGAETLRKENVNPTVPHELVSRRIALGLSPQPVAVVVTASADLPVERTFFRMEGFSRVIVTASRAPAERVAELERYARVLRIGADAVDLPAMMKTLRQDLGLRRLVVEGGPTLNSALMAEGMVDELFWTVAPKIVGGAAMRTMVEGKALPLDRVPRLELVSLYHHESELFLRYRLVAGPTSP